MNRAHRVASLEHVAHEGLDLQVEAAVARILRDFHERVHSLAREVKLGVRAGVKAPKVRVALDEALQVPVASMRGACGAR